MKPSKLWPHVLLLVCVAAPIARSEGSFAYLIAVVLAGGIGLLLSFRSRPPILTDQTAQFVVLPAFGWLLFEYVVLDQILFMALAHFLIIVHIIKLLQVRSLRDDAQMLVLTLMLLMVAAVVSGDILFAVALVVTLTLGLSKLAQLHLQSAMFRGTQTSRSACPADREEIPPGTSFRGVVGLAAMTGLAVGAGVFLLFPRVDSLVLREFQMAGTGPVLSGFGSSANLRAGQTIQSSDRMVMRVSVDGAASASMEEYGSDLYLRGRVSTRYGRRAGGLGGGWGWQRRGRGSGDEVMTIHLDEHESQLILGYTELPQNTMVCRIWLEPGHTHLFAPYPVLAVDSHDVSSIRVNQRDHILRMPRTRKLIRYAVTTAPLCTLPLIKYSVEDDLHDEPEMLAEVVLPRGDEIIRLIDREIGDHGDLNVAAQREDFVQQLEKFLRSPAFTYSLTTPKIPPGHEPVGEFLLEHRQGHCEYFASAMVLACQLKGVPARLVSGYCGGDYNPVGGFLVVREKHAHAWVEVFIPDKGWVVYDPTPAGSRFVAPAKTWLSSARGIFDFVDYLQFQWAGLVVAYDAAARQALIERFHAWLMRPARDETTLVGAVVAFSRELFGWRLEMSLGDRVLYWVFALLVVTLVLLVGYVLVTAARWLKALIVHWYRYLHTGHDREAEFYSRFCRRVEALGLRRRPDQTPAEFAADVAAAHPVLQAAPELIRVYYALVFGRQPVSPERASWIEEFLEQLKRLDRDSLTTSTAGGGPQ